MPQGSTAGPAAFVAHISPVLGYVYVLVSQHPARLADGVTLLCRVAKIITTALADLANVENQVVPIVKKQDVCFLNVPSFNDNCVC